MMFKNTRNFQALGVKIDNHYEGVGNTRLLKLNMCISYEPEILPCKHSYTFARGTPKNVHHSLFIIMESGNKM